MFPMIGNGFGPGGSFRDDFLHLYLFMTVKNMNRRRNTPPQTDVIKNSMD